MMTLAPYRYFFSGIRSNVSRSEIVATYDDG